MVVTLTRDTCPDRRVPSARLPQPCYSRLDYDTADGTAIAGQHYLAASGTLGVGPTLPEASFEVTILDDCAADGNHLVNLSLSDPVGLNLGSPATAEAREKQCPLLSSAGFRTGHHRRPAARPGGITLE